MYGNMIARKKSCNLFNEGKTWENTSALISQATPVITLSTAKQQNA